eukprot:SAG11_NODE_9790_length_880_cov_1.349552_2_plen_128_part_00
MYLALAVHSNLAVDMIEEDTLTEAGLAQYRAVIVAQPNLPAEGLTSLLEWVQATGGTLLTTSGAAAFDRYNTPVRGQITQAKTVRAMHAPPCATFTANAKTRTIISCAELHARHGVADRGVEAAAAP